MIQNSEIIKQLYRQFDKIQIKLATKPVLGAPKWNLTGYEILDKSGLIKINMDDGHIEKTAILQYSKETNTFDIIKEVPLW